MAARGGGEDGHMIQYSATEPTSETENPKRSLFIDRNQLLCNSDTTRTLYYNKRTQLST